MSTFDYKIGDIARVRNDANMYTFYDLIHRDEVARIIRVTDEERYKYRLRTDDGREETFCAEQLDPVARDLDHLQVGDVLIDEDDDEASVLAVLGDVLLISKWNAPSSASLWYTTEEAKKNGWKLKDSPTESVELTLEDVAKLKGVPVDQIKIVEK